MLRRALGAALLLLALPALASAWYVNAKANAGGTIAPSGNSKYYANSATVPADTYVVTAGAGKVIASVTLDGVAYSAAAGQATFAVPSFGYAGKAWRYLVANFTQPSVNIGLTVGAGGAVTVAGGLPLTNIPLGADRTLNISPDTGYQVASLDASGSPTISGNTVTYTNLQVAQTVSVTFSLIPVVTANAGPDITINGAGSSFTGTLWGSAVSNQGAITYAWAGAGLTFSDAAVAQPTVSAAVPGTYTATLSVTSNGIVRTDDVVVTVVSRAAYLETACALCHALSTPTVISNYDLSAHKTTSAPAVACQTCHNPAGNVSHYSDRAPWGSCATCHTGALAAHNGALPNCADCHDAHSLAAVGYDHDAAGFPTSTPIADFCSSCHNSGAPNYYGAPHFNGANAQYYQRAPNATLFVDAEVSCGQCHAGGDFQANRAILSQYADTRHGALVNGIWRGPQTNAGCATSCHDGQQLIKYLDDRVAPTSGEATNGLVAGRKTLACNSCHTDVESGAIRYYATGDADTFTYTQTANSIAVEISYPDFGASHLCVNCHSGTRAGGIGEHITETNNLPRPHYIPQGLTLIGRLGYEFPGRTYATGYHQNIGRGEGFTGSTSGPCVTCHMSGDAGHTWDPVTKDADGAITAVTNSACVACHDDMDAATLQGTKDDFTDATNALIAALAAKGVTYNPGTGNPTITYTNLAGTTANITNALIGTMITERYAGVVSPPTKKDLLGAIFNLQEFTNGRQDPAAYVHNWQYALELIADSIDLVNDGIINGNSGIALTARGPHLPFLANPTNESCLLCHEAPVSASHENWGTSCMACHAAPGEIGSPHKANEANAVANITVFARSTSDHGSSLAFEEACSHCHYTQLDRHTIGCAACHETTVPGRTPATTWYALAKAYGPPAGNHRDISASSTVSCLACHDPTASHSAVGSGSGHEGYYDDGSCEDCHAPPEYGDRSWPGPADCEGCHHAPLHRDSVDTGPYWWDPSSGAWPPW